MLKTLTFCFILWCFVEETFSAAKTVAIIGTNDIHGSALPTIMERSDTGEKYHYGGLPVLARLIQIIKN